MRLGSSFQTAAADRARHRRRAQNRTTLPSIQNRITCRPVTARRASSPMSRRSWPGICVRAPQRRRPGQGRGSCRRALPAKAAEAPLRRAVPADACCSSPARHRARLRSKKRNRRSQQPGEDGDHLGGKGDGDFLDGRHVSPTRRTRSFGCKRFTKPCICLVEVSEPSNGSKSCPHLGQRIRCVPTSSISGGWIRYPHRGHGSLRSKSGLPLKRGVIAELLVCGLHTKAIPGRPRMVGSAAARHKGDTAR